MSRYGDSPIGMVESAMEFLRIARDENYHQIILSMKSSNPQVMVQAYRLLVQKMDEEFGECYPLHLGVTEAGDGEDGRIKSAVGIGTLLEDGIGDTIRVSLTEDPEFEIPVCKDIVSRYTNRTNTGIIHPYNEDKIILPYNPFEYKRRATNAVENIGGHHVPVVLANLKEEENLQPADLEAIGYKYDEATDKWNIGDGAADYIYLGNKSINFALPGTLKVICSYDVWQQAVDKTAYRPLFDATSFNALATLPDTPHFVVMDTNSDWQNIINTITHANHNTVICLFNTDANNMPSIRRVVAEMMLRNIKSPVILCCNNKDKTIDEQLIDFATVTGGLLLDGMGDGVWLWNHMREVQNIKATGRTYLEVKNNNQFLNNTAFSILQATRTRISKTEYISCPSCGRTLFDLQETTAKIRNATNHLKGVKIAIMGCIVNGPGEMADADFGYVGSGPGKITLYKGKEVVKKNVPSEIAVSELIQLLKDNEAWIEPATV
jgi:(E)-4-hydroxy-3-methylbut-2-enyl-diphosphate synthase